MSGYTPLDIPDLTSNIVGKLTMEVFVRYRYPDLAGRVSGVRMIPDQPLGSITRQISYEFMNRQLVWSGFTVSSLLSNMPSLTLVPSG